MIYGLLNTRLTLHREDNESTSPRETRETLRVVAKTAIGQLSTYYSGSGRSSSESARASPVREWKQSQSVDNPCEKTFSNMPPTTPTDSAMCSLCPRSKKAHHPKKLVRFDSIVDTFSISDSNAATNERVRLTIFYLVLYSREFDEMRYNLCSTRNFTIFSLNWLSCRISGTRSFDTV